MSAKNLFFSENKEFSRADERVYAREELVYNVTEDILVTLEDLNVNKKELARRLGKSRSYVTQILGGARNMTLGTLSDICFALDVKPKITIQVESVLESLEATGKISWVTEKVDLRTDELIRKSENVFDYRDFKAWENQAA
ncbi:MAG: helix-turn-helix transcriptional regulator [Gammaproteobacteria bacterium]|nr:helix-turn-helix transcriptional regulator [Gammaproteobacteria bacterium]MCF6364194.1 helix-turn-helix transcriptional regulator [Gammaproteobacteria bacterium]